MRKSAFKKAAYILSFFLVTGLFSGIECSAADSPEADGNAAGAVLNKPVTIRYFCTLPPDAAEVVSSLSEVEVYKELEKKTNVKISFMHPTAEVQLNQFMLMIAAGDLPDLVELPWSKYPGMFDRAVEVGAVLKLDSLIEKNAPNLSRILRENNDIKRQATADDGYIYRFPSLDRLENKVGYGPVIRNDLLEKLGLAMPQTMDEWEMVLTMFRDHKVCKTPLTFDVTALNSSRSFMGAFGIAMDFCLDDGRVVYGPIEESYKDFITTFSRWYRTGLIDREFPVIKNTQANNKIANGDAGAFIGTANDMGNALAALNAVDTGYELIAAQNPVLHSRDKLDIYARIWEVNPAGGVVITSTNKYPVESVKWLDYAYSEEGCRLFNFGIEGKTYTMENGRPEFTGLILDNPEGLSVRQAMGKYLRAAPPVPGCRTDESVEAGYTYQEQKDGVKLWSDNADEKHAGLMPPITLTQKENAEISMIMKDVSAYANEMFVRFMVGAGSLDNFDEYVGKVKSMGIDRAIYIMQTALYRYNNRLEADRIKVFVDGKLLKMDTNPMIVNESVLVPVRFAIEALGGSVDWDEKTRSVTAVKGDIEIILKIDSEDVFINNERKILETAVMLLNDRTYVPAQFIAESIGAEAHWDENTRTVTILSHADEAD